MSFTQEECVLAEYALGKMVNSTDRVVRTRVTPAMVSAYRKFMLMRERFAECVVEQANVEA